MDSSLVPPNLFFVFWLFNQDSYIQICSSALLLSVANEGSWRCSLNVWSEMEIQDPERAIYDDDDFDLCTFSTQKYCVVV